MLKRLLSRLAARSSDSAASPRRRARPLVESLENRQLLHNPFVTGVIADNRGRAEITLDSDSSELAPSAFNTAVQMFTLGPDQLPRTADDVRIGASISFKPASRKLVVTANLAAQTAYRVRIVSDRVPIPGGGPFALDGEFKGTFPSGNGVAGGNFDMYLKNDNGKTPTARFTTNAGAFNIKLRKDLVGNTANNFIAYVNAGRYDGTIFHRNARTQSPPLGPLDIIQGGGYTGTGIDGLGNPTQHISTFAPIALQAGKMHNVRGTIAMARTNDPNSATSEFFLNTGDNRSILDPQPGSEGYACFGNITAGMSVVDAIFNTPSASVNSAFDAVAQFNGQNVIVQRAAMLALVLRSA